jgi:hypothetical protein
MVLSQTQEFVLSVVDAQQDMMIKYTIFCIIIIYAFLLWYIKKEMDSDTMPKLLFKFVSTIYIYVTIMFLPLFTMMLFREYAAISLWTLLLQLYSVVFVITALILIIFGWSKALSFVGIDIDIASMNQDRKLKGED